MVDTARLVARVETKGVKRATDELDRFGKEAGEAEGSTKKLGAALKGGAAAFAKAGVALGATAGALTAIAVKTANAQKEFQNFANIARTSVDDFKATAFATEQVGISAEKLADISKDTNEKLGEFIATGGGGFKDFFDEVAPKVGLTAEELQGLSGPQVLGRVQQAFEQANVPIEQQSFFLESIASDTTALIPLLANEGRELERLTGRYNELNDALKLSAGENSAVTQLSQSFNLLTETSGNAAAKITATLAPTLDAFFSSVAESVPTATQALIDFFNVFVASENLASLNTANERLEEVNERINELKGQDLSGGGRSGGGRRSELAKLNEEAETLNTKIKELQQEQKKLADAEVKKTEKIKGGPSTAEEDAIRESLDRRRQLRNDFNNAEFEAEQEYQIKREDAIAASLQREKDLRRTFDADVLQQEQDFQIRREQGIEKGLDNIASLRNSSDKRLFRIGQAAAIAQATVNIAQGVTEALKLGPILGPVLAGAQVAAGAVQLATITSQSPPSARQQGGQFSRGQDLLVGEKGPELVRFNSGGRIATADQTAALGGASSGPQVVVNNYASGTKATAETMSDGRVRVIVNEVLNAQVSQPNSDFNKNFDRTRKSQRRFS